MKSIIFWVAIDVSEEPITSIFRVEEYQLLATCLPACWF
jgi:hypothetical protein